MLIFLHKKHKHFSGVAYFYDYLINACLCGEADRTAEHILRESTHQQRRVCEGGGEFIAGTLQGKLNRQEEAEQKSSRLILASRLQECSAAIVKAKEMAITNKPR
ncbi:hypothetical protein DPMN_017145 [Dreissena polymorpha]|uniref:Uncharacterized protein n=1 Tax=Dreissena polymorpha TaxID=45954 RepID=A0A9D4NGY2_DREPO|nr:hypothetical protein DPMN_017145 [Dreissena polymorpha]